MKNERDCDNTLYGASSAAAESVIVPDSEEREMLDDAEFMESLEKAKQDRANRRYKKWEDVKREV